MNNTQLAPQTPRPVAAVASMPKPISHTVPGPGTQFSLTEMRGIAAMIAASRQYPNVSTEAQAFSQLLIGQTMGLSTMESLAYLRIIDGKPAMDATLIAAKIKNSGRYDFKIVTHTKQACKLTFSENGEFAGESEFTMQDAIDANLAGGTNWKRYPRNMLFARAITNGAKWYCAGVFGGPIYTPDELGANDRVETSGPEEAFEPTSEQLATAELTPEELAAQGIPVAPTPVEPAPPTIAQEAAIETPTEADSRERDVQRAVDLTSALGYSNTQVERSLLKRYNQRSLFDLTSAQLDEYVERLDEEHAIRTLER